METQSTANNYYCTLTMNHEDAIDFDDLMGMMAQIHAIQAGWASPIKVFKYEQLEYIWNGPEWTNPTITSSI